MFILALACAYAQNDSSADAIQKSDTGRGFAWGVAVSSSIDLTGNNMTYTGLDADFGYKNAYIQMLGVGAGINMMMSNSSASYPVYAVLQTNFSSKPSLCFMHLKGGVSFNRINDADNQTGGYVQGGVGFNLASGKTFRSHLLLSYTLITRNDFVKEDVKVSCPSLQFLSFGIGITF